MDMGHPEEKDVATAGGWQKAINEVIKAVVVVRTSICRSFDTDTAGVRIGTGFVVDKQRGIILTSRDLVIPGPAVAEVMFTNQEETTVQPIYGDPVHNFGFFRYNPESIKFLEYEEIPLVPEAACVGLDIKVIGNDSGEKVSILSGTLACLNREAPKYKNDGYNDFNTFYMQAATGTHYGSSGSPVIDRQGRAVAMHVGGLVSGAPAFFLPLERVVRALEFLQGNGDYYVDKWEAVKMTRGTLQVTFVYKGFDEILQLGLADAVTGIGMLVVDSVVPGSLAENHLKTGDVLVMANCQVITQFLELETLLDDNVDQMVQDLHSITPARFLEVSGAGIHPLSYQQARNFHFPCEHVYVSEPGYVLHRAGVPRHAIIEMFAGEVVSKLEDLISILYKLPRVAQVSVPPSCMLDDVHSQKFSGTGVIIYHSSSMGLVAADRNTVAISASDVMLSFAAYPVEIPGEVVFLHPAYNYALVAYKPSALGTVAASMVRAAQLLPSRFSGVLTDEHGRVQALWGRFSSTLRCSNTSKAPHFVGGIPVYAISQVLDKIKSGASGSSRLINGIIMSMPHVRILEAEFRHIKLSRARTYGLSEDWIQALFKKDPVSRQILIVGRCLERSSAQNLLVGDLVLAVNKEPVTCFQEIENVCQEMDNDDNDGKLSMTVFRRGLEIDLLVGTDLRDGNGTTRVINWCGCVVQHSYPAVRSLGFHPSGGAGVYVTRCCPGSPADRYGLVPLQWIVKVGGWRTLCLDGFINATKRLQHEEFVLVKTVDLYGNSQYITLKQDLRYWPTWEVRFDPETAIWRRTVIKAIDDSDNP
ncbi:hypothetical protein V6N11_075816 [Hibiscus sabdariffa]|uniref:PDZ domain-containing protein n=1 Tax=Hibiscus sabdariffa TaxID=183260 RepID=A0ABR2Q4D0_9ROSI